jgi:4-hydroxy-tetrahydrodipicolinate reductase
MNILIYGIFGKMGQRVAQQIMQSQNHTLVGGVDPKGRTSESFEVFARIEDAPMADVIIDFSYPEALENILTFAISHHVPLVLATTGYTDEQLQTIQKASAHIPIFQSSNTSFGVLVMRKLLALATSYLGDFDIELIEAHHNRKADAPSGTAKLLVSTINESLPVARTVVNGNHEGKRKSDAIGVHAIRAGAIVGDHTVLFANESESIEISHRAFSKEVFAQGALRAAQFIISAPVGLYSMDDLI